MTDPGQDPQQLGWWYWQAYRTWVPYDAEISDELEEAWLRVRGRTVIALEAVSVGDGREVRLQSGRAVHKQLVRGDSSRYRYVVRLYIRGPQRFEPSRLEAPYTLRHATLTRLINLDEYSPHVGSRLTGLERDMQFFDMRYALASMERTVNEQLRTVALGRNQVWQVGWEDASSWADQGGPDPTPDAEQQRLVGKPLCAQGRRCTNGESQHLGAFAHPTPGSERTIDCPVCVAAEDVHNNEALSRYCYSHGPQTEANTHFFMQIPRSASWFQWAVSPAPALRMLNGYSALVEEVVRNGFEADFQLPDAAPGQPRTLHDVVVQKSLHPKQQRLRPEDRLDFAQLLAVLLYTATRCQDDLHTSHRVHRDFDKWEQLRAVLGSAISQLHRTLPFSGWRFCDGRQPARAPSEPSGDSGTVQDGGQAPRAVERVFLYTGMSSTIFDWHGATLHGPYQPRRAADADGPTRRRRLPYCDFLSSSMHLATACRPRFLGKGGLLLQIEVDPNAECADVSWISKFGHGEAEVVFNPCRLQLNGEPTLHSLPQVTRSAERCIAADAMVLSVTPVPLLYSTFEDHFFGGDDDVY